MATYPYYHRHRSGCGCNSCKELATINQTNRTYNVPVEGLSAFEDWKLRENRPDATFEEFLAETGGAQLYTSTNW